jgi:2-isopropylmalate synthase
VDYAEHAAAPGAAARAVANVAVRLAGQTRYGAGRHEDVVLATFRAVVSAYNRLQGPVGAAAASGRA